MYDINLKVGDKIKYVGNEQLEYFTFGNVYEVQSIKSLGYLGKEMHIMVIDDANEENYITVPFYRKNFVKVEVTIIVYEDDTFVTETESSSVICGSALFSSIKSIFLFRIF